MILGISERAIPKVILVRVALNQRKIRVREQAEDWVDGVRGQIAVYKRFRKLIDERIDELIGICFIQFSNITTDLEKEHILQHWLVPEKGSGVDDDRLRCIRYEKVRKQLDDIKTV